MIRAIAQIALFLILSFTSLGCQFDIGPTGGFAYDADLSKLGTGEQVITPRNDAYFKDGERTGHRKR